MEDNDNTENNSENIKNTKNKNNLLNKEVPLNNNNNQKIRKGKTNLFVSNNFDTFSPYINFQSPILNINNKKNDSERENININNQTNEIKLDKINNNQLYSRENNKIEKTKNSIKNKNIKKKLKKHKSKGIHNIETLGEKNNSNINQKEIILSQTDEDLQDMDYEQAIIYDTRSYFRMYWGFLVETQIILGTFCTEKYLNLLVIKLSFLVFTFQISFFLNALFYTDEYISDAYHNDGVLDFVTGLPKSIYSFIATLITTNLLRMLSNSKSELKHIITKERKNKNYINLINTKLNKLRKKLIIYFILIFILGLLFLYYVSAFCAVYRYSQKYWFIGCLQSFGIDSAVAIAICIFLALFRYISIKKRIKYFYFLANLISTFL